LLIFLVKYINYISYSSFFYLFFYAESIGACYEKDSLCIVTEFLAGGSLENLLTRLSNDGEMLSLTRFIDYSIQICEGVNWLHQMGIIHR
jgi:serine/threonine protein kinase